MSSYDLWHGCGGGGGGLQRSSYPLHMIQQLEVKLTESELLASVGWVERQRNPPFPQLMSSSFLLMAWLWWVSA